MYNMHDIIISIFFPPERFVFLKANAAVGWTGDHNGRGDIFFPRSATLSF